MKKLLVLVFLVGCASPARSYVEAEAAAWSQIDDKLDAWIDAEPTYDADRKDALHQLMVGRKARVAHALAEFGQKTPPTVVSAPEKK